MPMFNFYYNRRVLSRTSVSSGLLTIKIKTLALDSLTLILKKLKARLDKDDKP